MTDEILKVENLRRLDVKPGDRFVLMTDDHLSAEACAKIQDAWKGFIGGEETKLLVLPKGFEIGVIRPQENEG